MAYNKLTSKYRGMEGFRYWIQKANIRYELSRPHCCPCSWQRGFGVWLKSRIAHFLICKRQEPWKSNLPHNPGQRVEDKYLNKYLDATYPPLPK